MGLRDWLNSKVALAEEQQQQHEELEEIYKLLRERKAAHPGVVEAYLLDSTSKPEWDQKLQTWTITTPLVFEAETRICLWEGRGGRLLEIAVCHEALGVEQDNLCRYAIEFLPENEESTHDKDTTVS